jgi:hypothetical protein
MRRGGRPVQPCRRCGGLQRDDNGNCSRRECRSAQAKAYHAAHRTQRLAQARAYHAANPEANRRRTAYWRARQIERARLMAGWAEAIAEAKGK